MTGTVTRASLLIRLRNNADNTAWTEFVTLYTPLLYSYAIQRGLQEADAADIAQETSRQVFKNIGRLDYDPARGTFRGWLLTIARNLIRQHVNQRAKTAVGTGDSQMNQVLANIESSTDDDQWEQEYRTRLFHLAAERIKSEFQQKTWKAFWMSSVEARDAGEVAETLSMTIGAIYIARSRVIKRLREEVACLEAMH
jgi:RNA polymerase sigma factor (sigma-70 family)